MIGRDGAVFEFRALQRVVLGAQRRAYEVGRISRSDPPRFPGRAAMFRVLVASPGAIAGGYDRNGTRLR